MVQQRKKAAELMSAAFTINMMIEPLSLTLCRIIIRIFIDGAHNFIDN